MNVISVVCDTLYNALKESLRVLPTMPSSSSPAAGADSSQYATAMITTTSGERTRRWNSLHFHAVIARSTAASAPLRVTVESATLPINGNATSSIVSSLCRVLWCGMSVWGRQMNAVMIFVVQGGVLRRSQHMKFEVVIL